MKTKFIRIYSFFFIAATTLLSGCVSTNTSSQVLVENQAPIERLLISVRSASFDKSNTASMMAESHLRDLNPHLESNLPTIFSLNGIESRTMRQSSASQEDVTWIGSRPRILIISPISAYSSKSGTSLTIRGSLLDAVQKRLSG